MSCFLMSYVVGKMMKMVWIMGRFLIRSNVVNEVE